MVFPRYILNKGMAAIIFLIRIICFILLLIRCLTRNSLVHLRAVSVVYVQTSFIFLVLTNCHHGQIIFFFSTPTKLLINNIYGANMDVLVHSYITGWRWHSDNIKTKLIQYIQHYVPTIVNAMGAKISSSINNIRL